MISENLRARCVEILEWQKTGVLRDGVLRDFAKSIPYATKINELRCAENLTATECFEVIVNLDEELAAMDEELAAMAEEAAMYRLLQESFPKDIANMFAVIQESM